MCLAGNRPVSGSGSAAEIAAPDCFRAVGLGGTRPWQDTVGMADLNGLVRTHVRCDHRVGEERQVVRHWWNRRWGSGRMDVHLERAGDDWVVAIREVTRTPHGGPTTVRVRQHSPPSSFSRPRTPSGTTSPAPTGDPLNPAGRPRHPCPRHRTGAEGRRFAGRRGSLGSTVGAGSGRLVRGLACRPADRLGLRGTWCSRRWNPSGEGRSRISTIGRAETTERVAGRGRG